MATIVQGLRERLTSSSAIFFAGTVLFLQIAVYYAAGGKLEVDMFNRTIGLPTPDWYKWIWGVVALAFLIWALVLLLTARYKRLTLKIGQSLERISHPLEIIAVITTALAWVQSVLFAAQGGFGDYYFFTLFILGLAFCIMYFTFNPRHTDTE